MFTNESLGILINVLQSDSTDDAWLRRTTINLANELIRIRAEIYAKP